MMAGWLCGRAWTRSRRGVTFFLLGFVMLHFTPPSPPSTSHTAENQENRAPLTISDRALVSEPHAAIGQPPSASAPPVLADHPFDLAHPAPAPAYISGHKLASPAQFSCNLETPLLGGVTPAGRHIGGCIVVLREFFDRVVGRFNSTVVIVDPQR